jgi:4-methyl-5(b-hydroxyethyl)-thiazole monophosphate biosynthesis
MQTIAVFLADGFEEVEGITQIDFLRRAGLKVITAGIGKTTITGGHEIQVQADVEISDLQTDLDGVVIPGGKTGAENIARSEKAISRIQKLFNSGKLIAAICASPAVVLSPAGVLTGKKATCYPGFENRLTDSTFVEDRVVVEGNVITSRGPGTAAEFAEAIVRYLIGDEAARDLHERTLQK